MAKKHNKKKQALRPEPPQSKKPGKGVGLFPIIIFIILVVVFLYYFKRPSPDNEPKFLPKIPSNQTTLFPKSTPKRNQLAPFPPSAPISSDEGPTFDDFVGSDSCAECHKKQYQSWKGSTHSRAGGAPSAEIVISNFNGTELVFKDAVVNLSVNSDKKYLFKVRQEKQQEKTFKADAVVGGGFMIGGGSQAFFSEFPDGTLRFLPFDFHREERLWFCQMRDERGWIPINKEISIEECVHWPPFRVLGSEINIDNPCQQCHGSQIQLTYSQKDKKFVTRYKSLGINCESCHGPGKKHIEMAKSGNMDTMSDIGMKPLSTLDKDESLTVCFQCHARKGTIEESGNNYLPGKELDNHFVMNPPTLDSDATLYPDGRIIKFAYQKNHLYSDCYLSGSMTCVDCHDPHSQGYRDINGEVLKGKLSNGQCLGCHASKILSPELHSHHKPDSTGNLCVSCHMPFLQHKLLGKRLRFSRSDHTIPIPRPEFDVLLGTENACQQCHKEKKISWLQKKTEEWYGEIKPHKDVVSGLRKSKNVTDRQTAGRLLLSNNEYHPSAQISNLSYFIKNFLSPDMPSPEPQIIEWLKELSKSDDIDLKALALMSLHLAAGENANIHDFLLNSLKASGDKIPKIKVRWMKALNSVGLVYIKEREYKNALVSYKKALEIKFSDYAQTYNDIASVLIYQGKINEAITNFDKALKFQPNSSKILKNKGVVLGAIPEKINEAIAIFKKVLEIKPFDAETHNEIGVLYSKQGKTGKAISHFSKAVQIKSGFAKAHFHLGLTLATQGKTDKAITHYTQAIAGLPNNATVHYKLGMALGRQGNIKKARIHFSEALRIDPTYANAHFRLGLAWFSLNQNQKALNSLSQAHSIFKKQFGKDHPKTRETERQMKNIRQAIK